MGQDAGGQGERGPTPVAPGTQSPCHEAEEHEGDGDAQRIGILTGQRREEIPAVNGVRVVEEVTQRDGRQGPWERPPHPEEPPHGPRRHR